MDGRYKRDQVNTQKNIAALLNINPVENMFGVHLYIFFFLKLETVKLYKILNDINLIQFA